MFIFLSALLSTHCLCPRR